MEEEVSRPAGIPVLAPASCGFVDVSGSAPGGNLSTTGTLPELPKANMPCGDLSVQADATILLDEAGSAAGDGGGADDPSCEDPSRQWHPDPPIDVTGASAVGQVVADGSEVTLSITGTGLDFDQFSENCQPGGEEQEDVTITWTGADFPSGNTGASATLKLPFHSEQDINITVTAVDAASAPGRDDQDVVVQTGGFAVWVRLSLQTSGPLPQDAIDQGLGYPEGYGDANTTGPTQPGVDGSSAFATKVLIIGTTQGMGPFAWKHTVSYSACSKKADGTWQDPQKGTDIADDPDPQGRTTTPVNGKIYMLDAPGLGMPNYTDPAEIHLYQEFKTWVEMGGKRASEVLQWHSITQIQFDGNNWVGMPSTPNHAELGPASLPQTDCAREVYTV
jgi:hypothetical protein